jgi:hypothetical protein
MKFDKLDVPSCWQYNGYGNPMYLNARYPFRFNPPKIPTLDPVTRYFSFETLFTHAKEGEYNHLGVYRTFFTASKKKKRYIYPHGRLGKKILSKKSCLTQKENHSKITLNKNSSKKLILDSSSILDNSNNNVFKNSKNNFIVINANELKRNVKIENKKNVKSNINNIKNKKLLNEYNIFYDENKKSNSSNLQKLEKKKNWNSI